MTDIFWTFTNDLPRLRRVLLICKSPRADRNSLTFINNMNWELLFLRASRMPFIPTSLSVQFSASNPTLARQLNVKVARLTRVILRPISSFGTASSRPAKHGRSAVPASSASGPLPQVLSGPNTVLRFKHIPSTATLDYLLGLLLQYGRVLRVQSRKSTQVSTLVVVLMVLLSGPH